MCVRVLSCVSICIIWLCIGLLLLLVCGCVVRVCAVWFGLVMRWGSWVWCACLCSWFVVFCGNYCVGGVVADYVLVYVAVVCCHWFVFDCLSVFIVCGVLVLLCSFVL